MDVWDGIDYRVWVLFRTVIITAWFHVHKHIAIYEGILNLFIFLLFSLFLSSNSASDATVCLFLINFIYFVLLNECVTHRLAFWSTTSSFNFTLSFSLYKAHNMLITIRTYVGPYLWICCSSFSHSSNSKPLESCSKILS